MSRRTAAWLAWSLFAVCVVLIALTLLLHFIADDSFPFSPWERPDLRFAVPTGVLSLAYPTVGALIASRLPSNSIGWLFCGVGLLYDAHRFTMAYADYALLENFALPGAEYAAWFSTLVGLAGWGITAVFLMLLFPDGRLLSPRWRIVAWVAVFGATSTALADAFMPGTLPTHNYVVNPFGLVGVIGGGFTTYHLFPALWLLGTALLLIGSLAALFSLILRLHRATGDQRQQLKWFLYAAVPLTVLGSLDGLDLIVANITTDFMSYPVYILYSLGLLLPILYVEVLALLAVPVCTYIAILRYRLYDIDVVINRTLVYGALTALLAAVYVGSVVSLQGALRTVTGQESQLAVIASTLLIAVIFNPLRGRIQAFVDRRFYRKKYDAAKTLEAFSAKLRDETDLDALNDDLVRVVRETMQPAHVALWLRPDTAPKRERLPE
jgi:hypothetical protein